MNNIFLIPEKDTIELFERYSILKESIGKIPEEFLKKLGLFFRTKNCFDPNMYFEVFNKIKLMPGYILDFLYINGGIGGEPILFTRKITDSPKQFVKQTYLKNDSIFSNICYVNHIKFENSPMGFFQFEVFKVVINQFYLFWHSLYNDLYFISGTKHLSNKLEWLKKETPNEFERIINEFQIVNKCKKNSMNILEYSPFNEYKSLPSVEYITNDKAIVNSITFSSYKGLVLRTSYIQWPNLVENTNEKVIFNYNYGIIY